MSFHLPHEIVQILQKHSILEKLLDRDGLDPVALRHLLSCEEEAACILLALGLWFDECPCNWDRTESIAVLSLNLPGQTGTNASIQLPITCFSEKQKGPNTWHDIMSVVKWSLDNLATQAGQLLQDMMAQLGSPLTRREKLAKQCRGPALWR